MQRDRFELPKGEALAAAHARIDALLDEVAGEKQYTYSMELDITAFEAGKALTTAADPERTENTVAALLRYTTLAKQAGGGIYSPGDYTPDDYRMVVMRAAETLLRKKMRFDEALLDRMVGGVAEYAADNVRGFPIKTLLGQVENFVKVEGRLPDGLRASLGVIVKRVDADAARYPANGKPPKILREVSDRVRALLDTPKTKKPKAKK